MPIERLKEDESAAGMAADFLETETPSSEGADAFGEPVAFQLDGKAFIEEGADLPTDVCIQTGFKAAKTAKIQVRKPLDPKTWFGKAPQIEVGLSKKAHENLRVMKALTYSVVAVCLIIELAGAATFSVVTVVTGLLAAAGSGFFRSRVPVTTPDPKAEPLEIAGASENFIQRLPQSQYCSE